MKLFLFSLSILKFSFLFSQAPEIEWQKSLGGSANEIAQSIQQTIDGGYITIGFSSSNDGDVTNSNGWVDVWIVKLDSFGNLDWQKCLGGSNNDEGNSIQQTTDGGYIFVGCSASSDGDVSSNHGSGDFWVVKLDISGVIEWEKSYGGSSYDLAYSIQQTRDNGYIVVGGTESNDGNVTENHGNRDFWVIKLNPIGDIEWEKSFGGSDNDHAFSVESTSNGYIIAGASSSDDGDTTFNHGESDYWIIKLDELGNLQWQKSLGGSEEDIANFIQSTIDGGYIVAGYSQSNDGDLTENNGSNDYWIVKLDFSGNIEWQKSFGGFETDVAYSIQQTIDNGYISCGFSYSVDYEGDGNIWILKLDEFGNMIWQKSIGGSHMDAAYYIQQTIDGGFIMAGDSISNDGDISNNHGNLDFCIVRLAADTASVQDEESNKISIYPNPTNDILNFSEILFDIEIFSFDGKKIISIEESNQINIAKFLYGIYFLKAKTIKGKAINKKFMKN